MKWLRRLLPYAAVLAIVVLLLRQIDPVEVLRLLARADGRWLLLGVAAYVSTNVLRAYRYGVLLAPDAEGRWGSAAGPQGAFGQRALAPLRILPEMFALSFLNNTLPSRAGEVSFPYFMWRRHAAAVGETSAALIVARVFDYVAVALLYVACASANLGRLNPAAAVAVRIVGLLLLVSLLGLAAAPWIGDRVLDALQWLLARLGLSERRAPGLVLRVGREAAARFRAMRTPRIYGLTLFWSLLTWLGTFAWFAAFMQAMGIGRPFGLVVVGATFAMLAKAAPFITVGGFGAHEAGWTLGFSLVGMPVDLAIASGFAVNILTLLVSTVFGGAALLLMQAQERSRTAARAGSTPPPATAPEGPEAP